MRTATWIVLLGMVLAWLWISATPGEGEATFSPGAIQLELPELGEKRYPPGILRVPEPENIRRLVLHIPLPRIHQAFPKINTIGTGLVQTIKARKDEVLCEIDLSLNQGRYYALSAADNTVEIKVVPKPGADPLYAQWVIAPPKEPQAWQTRQRVEGGDGSLARAEMSAEGLVVLEELEDGRLIRLDKGVTTARRVFLQARFPHREESVSLRIHWAGEEGAERTFSVGSWSGGSGGKGGKAADASLPTLEGNVDLALGQNRLDVEVMHGYTTLSRSTYKIYRRAPSSPTAVAGEKWAVVIGISDYRADGLDLRYAHRDAEAIRDFLVEKGGFRPDKVQLLSNQNATYQGIRTALFNFLAATQPEDLVLIFLAGHGVQDPVNPDNYFFLAHDSEVGNLGGTAIPMWDLGNVMDYTIRSQRILVFADTCHSGAALDRGVNDGENLNFFNKYLEVLARKKGRLVVTASQAHESSLETTKLAHGVFTQSMLLGLGGAADDNPADGVVTAGELVDYVRTKVPEETEGEQHPSYSEQDFDMNLPLAYVRRDKAAKH
ncbi:MAG TPA: caspase family protein [Thermoanaerobaculia bacterium]|nr:caspase family protein [Thermoanaerobaculia bacterium]